MQKVLSTDLWTEIRERACASKSRKAAIAYVMRDLVGFREGDTLVVNASAHAQRECLLTRTSPLFNLYIPLWP